MNRRKAHLVLGLADECSPVDVKLAYRRLALLTHPDAGGNAAAFRQVHDAYETLLNSSVRPEDTEEQTSTQAGGPAPWDFRLASLAMSYLGVDPETLAGIAEICNNIDEQVKELGKRAAKQLLWLAAGRVPVGAAMSVARSQKYCNTARRMLDTLARIQTADGIRNTSLWMQFAEHYKPLLRLVEQDQYSAQISVSDLRQFLRKSVDVLNSNNSADVEALYVEAHRRGEAYTVIDRSLAPQGTEGSHEWARKLGKSIGRRVR